MAHGILNRFEIMPLDVEACLTIDMLMEFVSLTSSWPSACVDGGSELPWLAHFRGCFTCAICAGCLPLLG